MSGPSPVHTDFEGLEGQRFPVTATDWPAPAQLTLLRVRTWGAPWAEGTRQPFTLEFEGPGDPFLPQGIYQFQHPGLGVLELFVVPLGPIEGTLRYEIVLA